MCLKGREAVFFRRFLGRSPYTQVRTFLVLYIYILNSLLHPMWLSTAVSLPVLRLISCFLILIAVLVRVVAYLHAVRDCR